MVTENSWTESGEVGETPVGMRPLPPATSESISLFSTPPYPGIGEELTGPQEHRSPCKSKSTLPPTRQRMVIELRKDVSPEHETPSLPIQPPPSPFEDEDDVSLCLPLGLSNNDPTFADDISVNLGDTLFSAENEPQDDIKDSSAVPGVCGLRNLGNTCFMSAGLQCLSNTSTLLHFFVSHPPSGKFPPDTLTAQFSVLLHRMWSGENRVVHPVEFKQSLGTNFPQFKDYRQHDCQEFLALLLDSLHEQLNTVEQASPRNPDQAQSLDRFSNSSLSHSSESSGEMQSTFRVQPIPANVAPFRLAESTNSTNNQALNYSLKKGQLALQLNCTSNSMHLHDLQDILKDAKTSNVNVLVEEQEANNTIRFDSDKYPRYETVSKLRELPNRNLLEIYDFDNKVSVKRIKDTNVLQEHTGGEGSESGGLDLKRIKLTDQNNCHRECNLLFEDAETASNVVDRQKQTNSDLPLSFMNGVRQSDDTESAQSSTSGQPADAEDCLTMESFPESSEGAGVASSDGGINMKEDLQADQHWEKHLSSNQSTIVDTFLGQFKSTVVCSECKHVSVTYEPFMYLSVPLPHAMERQVCVTYIPCQSEMAIQYLVTLNKQDKVRQLREELLALRSKEGHNLAENANIVLAEVLENHIAKILDDATPLRHMNDLNRSIYAVEVLPPPAWHNVLKEPSTVCSVNPVDDTDLPVLGCDAAPYPVDAETGEPLDSQEDKLTADSAGVSDNEATSSEDEDPSKRLTGGRSTYHPRPRRRPAIRVSIDEVSSESMLGCDRGDDWKSCAICLEDMNRDMRRHIGCDCVLCEGCIENACKHNGSSDEMPCPVCNQIVKPNLEFVRIDKLSASKPAVRLLNVPVVFRLDTEGDGNNNQKSMKLFGHPNVLRLPSVLQASDLAAAIRPLVHTNQQYSILTVDGVGYHCSRCLYTKHCRGCHLPSEGEVVLRSADTLAVRFMQPIIEPQAIQHSSLHGMRSQEPLSLYDCLKAFSESELLDEHNPWYCPTCQKNQCATKTLSVWRYPDFLIVYLKRFVFHNGMSTKLDNKVTYPLNGLVVNAPSAHTGTPHVYNLYACVCHYGGVSAGHYTAYAKNPINSEWHYFNDETVSRQKPQDEDYSNAYVLFYQKQGLAFPEHNLEEPMKPNIEHLIERLDSTMDQDLS